jgi:uncharacterized protein
MLLPFVKEDNVLNQNPFMRHEVLFNLIHRIADDSGALLLRSKDNNSIIARSNPNFPMWVWVNPNTSIRVVHNSTKEIEKIILEEECFEIISTPQVLKVFFEDYHCQHKKVMEMESYLCKEVLMPSCTPGIMKLSSVEDVNVVADFCVGFIYDGFGKTVSKESQLKGAERMINRGNLYVLEVNNEVVSMANIAHKSPRHARINSVYTPPNHRKKGYASKLVACLSKLVLSEGFTPVLYTDLTNRTSNKVYKDIGYIECGTVHHYMVTNIKKLN